MLESGGSDADRRLTQLFHAHFHDVRNYVTRHAPGAHVDDIVSLTFITAGKRLDHAVEGKECAWLIGIARNVIRNTNKAERRRARFVYTLIAARPRSTARLDDDVVPIDLRETLTRAFGELSDADQEILLLDVWEGLSSSEIAEVLAIPVKQAIDRLHRAKKRFRQQVLA